MTQRDRDIRTILDAIEAAFAGPAGLTAYVEPGQNYGAEATVSHVLTTLDHQDVAAAMRRLRASDRPPIPPAAP